MQDAGEQVPAQEIEEPGMSYPGAFGLGCLLMFGFYGFYKFVLQAWAKAKRDNLP